MKKKLFAIALTLVAVFMLTSFNTQAATVEPNEQTSNAVTSILDHSNVYILDANEREEVKSEKITLEFLKQMSSWEELLNNVGKILADPDLDIFGGNVSLDREDGYVITLIQKIKWPTYVPIYHDAKYVWSSLEARLDGINYDRLMQKCQAIIDLYNSCNELQLVWKAEANEKLVIVDVMSTNAEDLNRPATAIGQRVVLKEGAKYWQSSWNDGSGRYGVVTDNNCYIPEDNIVTVNGVAYLDPVRTNVTESSYKPYSELGGEETEIKIWEHRMLHICTETTDLGWIYPEDVVRL